MSNPFTNPEETAERFGGAGLTAEGAHGEYTIYVPRDDIEGGPLDYYFTGIHKYGDTPHLIEGTEYRKMWEHAFSDYDAEDPPKLSSLCGLKLVDMRVFDNRHWDSKFPIGHYLQLLANEDRIPTSATLERHHHDPSKYNVMVCKRCQKSYQSTYEPNAVVNAIEKIVE